MNKQRVLKRQDMMAQIMFYSLLTGYEDAPEGFEMAKAKHYNPYFEGRQISSASANC